MALLSRLQLLVKDELKKEKVVLGSTIVSESILGEDGVVITPAVTEEDFVYVRQMTAHEKSVWEISQVQKSGSGKKTEYNVTLDDYRAKLAVNCICDEEGTLLFTPADYKMLSMNISAAKLEKIVDVAQKLNAISEEDREEIVKNS